MKHSEVFVWIKESWRWSPSHNMPWRHRRRAEVESSWNVMAHGEAGEEKWRGNKRMEWVASKRHMTAEHRLARAVETLQTDAHSSPAISRLNWRPCRFKWTRPFRRRTKSGFCACAITFQTQSTALHFHLGAKWGWVVNDTPRPLYPRERPGNY
jgi:hypothetical protein